MNARATPQGYLLNLIGRSEVALDTLEVRFTKPPGFTFKAGRRAGFHVSDGVSVVQVRLTVLYAQLSAQ